MQKIRNLIIYLLLALCVINIGAQVLGDVNNDSNINIVDALLIAQYYVGIDVNSFNPSAADVDCNKSVNIVDALFIAQFYVQAIPSLPCSSPNPTPDPSGAGIGEIIGFATVNDWGQDGTTGGAGGEEVTPKTAEEFINYIKQDGPLIIKVVGELVLPNDPGMYEVTSDKSIIGVGSDAKISGGGLEIGTHLWSQRGKLVEPPANATKNIIIQNIWFDRSYCDNISIMLFSHHIWVDHCRFSNAPERIPEKIDGRGVDIKRGANFITVSYCLWDSTVPEGGLVGVHGGSQITEQELGRQKVTFHHNWWNGVKQPTHQIMHGQVHYINNLWTDTGDACIAVGNLAQAISENGVVIGGKYTKKASGKNGGLKDIGTIGGNSFNPENVKFNPSDDYQYTVDPVDTVEAHVKANVGPGKI